MSIRISCIQYDKDISLKANHNGYDIFNPFEVAVFNMTKI